MRALLCALFVLASPVAAQQSSHDPAGHDHAAHGHGGEGHAGHDHGPATDDSPTGLSADEMRGLRLGAGLGLAKAAELNHYPGPLHVIELAEDLGLSTEQIETARRLRSEMLFRAIPLGEQIIAAERQLDALFASETATPETVSAQTVKIGELRGRLRAVHLTAHLGMRAALTPEQITRYDQLRGYASASDS